METRAPFLLWCEELNVADIHATILHTLGVDFKQDLETPIGRMLPISEGRVIQELLA